ncbi:MAG: hypothetical protein IK005_10235 [Paludibacteraceae bacterium]|nr:hypothetical protein [Paludibacteraceae bacterium]
MLEVGWCLCAWCLVAMAGDPNRGDTKVSDNSKALQGHLGLKKPSEECPMALPYDLSWRSVNRHEFKHLLNDNLGGLASNRNDKSTF